MRWTVPAGVCCLAWVSVSVAGAGSPEGETADAGAGGAWIEPFPGVRVDRERRVVSFNGMVPIDAHDPETPRVYLEVIVCPPDTKEHETLVMADVRPSHVHAALLLLDIEPGKPGTWTWDGETMRSEPPRGPVIDVVFFYTDDEGNEREVSAKEWVVNAETGQRLGDVDEEGETERDGRDDASVSGDEREGGEGTDEENGRDGGGDDSGEGSKAPDGRAERVGWVFAGSRFVEVGGGERYDADMSGTLVGLATFGGETVAWRAVISHESAVQEPEWIAERETIPEYGTEVRVELRVAE